MVLPKNIIIFQKHPHVIFESHAKFNSGCANKGNLEWRMKGHNRKTKHTSSFFDFNRTKRDVREATKYIETALIVDRSMVRFYAAVERN